MRKPTLLVILASFTASGQIVASRPMHQSFLSRKLQSRAPSLALVASEVRPIYWGRSGNTALELFSLILPTASARNDLRSATRDFSCFLCSQEQIHTKIWHSQVRTAFSKLTHKAQYNPPHTNLQPSWSERNGGERKTIYIPVNKASWKLRSKMKEENNADTVYTIMQWSSEIQTAHGHDGAVRTQHN